MYKKLISAGISKRRILRIISGLQKMKKNTIYSQSEVNTIIGKDWDVIKALIESKVIVRYIDESKMGSSPYTYKKLK